MVTTRSRSLTPYTRVAQGTKRKARSTCTKEEEEASASPAKVAPASIVKAETASTAKAETASIPKATPAKAALVPAPFKLPKIEEALSEEDRLLSLPYKGTPSKQNPALFRLKRSARKAKKAAARSAFIPPAYECMTCFLEFQYRWDLLEHMKTSSHGRKCGYCGLVFAFEFPFCQHMNFQHDKMKAWMCQACGYATDPYAKVPHVCRSKKEYSLY